MNIETLKKMLSSSDDNSVILAHGILKNNPDEKFSGEIIKWYWETDTALNDFHLEQVLGVNNKTLYDKLAFEYHEKLKELRKWKD